MNLASGLGMAGSLVGPRRLERLLGGLDLHHHFSGNRSRALTENFTDLAHRFERLGVFSLFVAVLRSSAAGALLRRRLTGLTVGFRVFGLILITSLIAIRVGLGAAILVILLAGL